MEVILSKRARRLLTNASSRRQIASALAQSSEERTAAPVKVRDGKRTYSVVLGIPKTVKK